MPKHEVLDLTGGHYFTEPFKDYADFIAKARDALKGVKYDTLVGTGLSGAVAVPQLARALRKKFAIVRKKKDGSHSNNRVEGIIGKRWVFVDDLISSGDTRRRVKKEIAEVCSKAVFDTEYVTTYLYAGCDPRLDEGPEDC